MASNDPGQGHGLEIVVAFVVVVFLAFFFLRSRHLWPMLENMSSIYTKRRS